MLSPLQGALRVFCRYSHSIQKTKVGGKTKMNVKIEYSFGDWRDWFLIERKGFIIKSPFLSCEFLFIRKDESLHKTKLKVPLITKEMHIMYSCNSVKDLPEAFRVTCLNDELKIALNAEKIHILDFTKVEKVQKTFCSTHKVNVSDKVMSDCRGENYIRKFRFNKGVMGYNTK